MPSNFDHLPSQQQAWIQGYVNGSLDEATFGALQDALARDARLRRVFRRYLALDDHLRRGSEEGSEATAVWTETEPAQRRPKPVQSSWSSSGKVAWPIAVAACIALGFTSWWMLQDRDTAPTVAQDEEAVANGYAVITRLYEPVWPTEATARMEGETLGSETFTLDQGTAEIRFFCGASLTLQGPASLTLDSAWQATCHEGSLRVQVPPAARGFRLQAPETEIVDLGTEFGLEVRDGEAQVAVFDGEIEISHRNQPMQLVTEGKGWKLPSDGEPQPSEVRQAAFPDLNQLDSEMEGRRQLSFERWQQHRDLLKEDPRLISYYTFEQEADSPMVPSLAHPRDGEHDGAVILAERVNGRWQDRKPAYEFRRPGSRVRVNIPGEFPAFTFSCWVRIDALDRMYSALFMGDGYETGEPHWQIKEDGRLMLSVMVDDTQPNPNSPNDAGLHRVYYSPPIWDMAMSGQWLHLTSVYDPLAREVRHYADGECVHRQEIIDRFFIDTLRIGPAEIGNWGEPFRDTPWFAIRHLNGRMDELAIFKAALTDDEVRSLYQASRSDHR